MTRDRRSTARGKAPVKGQLDLREQPYNVREVGPIERVQLPQSMITRLHGIVLDIDLRLLRRSRLPDGAKKGPKTLYRMAVADWLARHPVLSRAEVRCTGRGLHIIPWLAEPVDFASDGDRQHWAGIVQVVQRVLPIDPDQPGVTCLTRPIGSINSKNDQRVECLKPGQRVPVDEVLKLHEEMSQAPFRTVAGILLGGGRVSPCPICRREESSLTALDRFGQCYGSCGRVKLASLFDLYLLPRSKGVRS